MQLPENATLVYGRPKEESSCSYCSKPNTKSKCARCTKAKYCNRDCQTAHWKASHKRECIPFEQEGVPKPMQPTANKPPSAEVAEERVRMAMKNAKAGKTDPNDCVCDTCKAVSKCLDTNEGPSPGGGSFASAVFVCANGHRKLVTDVRSGLEQNCHCKIDVFPLRASLTPQQAAACKQWVPSTLRLLIVTNFGNNMPNSVYKNNFTPMLQTAGIPFDIIQADNGPGLTTRLMSKKYSALMFMHLDDRGFDNCSAMFDGNNLGTLYHWISFGGKFICHGEGEGVTQLLRSFLCKPWHFCGDFYRRVKHSCNRKDFHHFPLRSTTVPAAATSTTSSRASAGAGVTDAADSDNDEADEAGDGHWVLPKSINMKATMLCGVAPEDRLYSPKPGARCISAVPGFGGHVVNPERTGIAYSPLGQGFVCYVGDVNAETKTLEAILTLLRLPKRE